MARNSAFKVSGVPWAKKRPVQLVGGLGFHLGFTWTNEGGESTHAAQGSLRDNISLHPSAGLRSLHGDSAQSLGFGSQNPSLPPEGSIPTISSVSGKVNPFYFVHSAFPVCLFLNRLHVLELF